MSKYEIEIEAAVTVSLTVSIDDDFSVDAVKAAALEQLGARLHLLDITGARGGRDGSVIELDITDVTNWNAL